MNYFGISEFYRPIPELDHWLRRRVRMCYFKQWRKTRTKVRKLLKLGASLNAAISVGLSCKGYWRLSRTLATQTGMTNQWLKEPGAKRTRVGFHKSIVGEHSLSGYGPISSVNRPVRTRMRGGVGAGGAKPPATRLCVLSIIVPTHSIRHSGPLSL